MEPGSGRDDAAIGSRATIRTGTPHDAPVAAKLHSEQISEGFLASLGSAFLTRLYRRIAQSPGSFLLVAESDGRPVGFLAGTRDVGALYKRFMVRDGIVAAVAAAPRLLRAWPRAFETLRHGGGRRTEQLSAELLAVAVDPGFRGRRIGGLLVGGFLDEMRRGGVDAAKVVVGASNRPAVAMYEAAGFERAESFEMHPGTVSLMMRWSLK